MFHSRAYGAAVSIKIIFCVSIYAEVYIIQCFARNSYR